MGVPGDGDRRDVSLNFHSPVPSVLVMNSNTAGFSTAVQRSELVFRKLLATEIADYVRRYEVTRFAGAFDGDGVIRFADRVGGSYNFATGLALSDLVTLLRKHGVAV